MHLPNLINVHRMNCTTVYTDSYSLPKVYLRILPAFQCMHVTPHLINLAYDLYGTEDVPATYRIPYAGNF